MFQIFYIKSHIHTHTKATNEKQKVEYNWI